MKLRQVKVWVGLAATCFAGASVAAEEPAPIVLLEVRGTIDPAVAGYVARGLEAARQQSAAAVVLRLDTPGGLDGSMRTIIQGILNAPVPVITYVAPQGARAASAGALIVLASHVAAMAPGTNIGAAHPVQLGGREEPERADGLPSVMQQKLTNDASAYARSIAAIRGRDVDWAERAVRESRSASADEARLAGAIDLIAGDLDDLLRQAEGRLVKTSTGETTLAALVGRPRLPLPMSAIERALHQLAHPQLAYILLLIGIYGLIYELATPGAVFPGVLGGICLIVALAALETLEVNWAGFALILLSAIFFIADIKLPGYGALTIGGIFAFLIGSALLFPGVRLPRLTLPWATIGAATATTAAFFLGIVGAGVRALRAKVVSGVEGLIGATGVAKTELAPEGLVQIRGEAWRARAVLPVPQGRRIKVIKLEGLTVHVEPLKED